MNELPNLDHLDALARGEQPTETNPFVPFYGMGLDELQALDDQPEPDGPSDSKTQARCLMPLLAIPGVVKADQFVERSQGTSNRAVPERFSRSARAIYP